MNTKILLSLFFIVSFQAFGQSGIGGMELAYSYMSDKRYNVIHELNGQVFIPAKYQESQDRPVGVSPGAMRIKLTNSRVTIEGIDNLSGTFQVLTKQEGKVGYVYDLLDGNGKEARLKVVVDQDSYVNLLYFNSKTLGEHTFFLAEKSAEELSADKNYFTAKDKYFIRSYSNLVKKEIFPYKVIENMEIDHEKERLYPDDNVYFKFSEDKIETTWGTFPVKKAETFAFRLAGHPGVKSMIAVSLKKKKPNKMNIYLNFKQQVEVIEIGKKRYYLHP